MYIELQGLALLFEESSMLVGEEWCDLAIHPCVVLVDPSDLLGRHAAEVHHMGVVWAEGECLKLEESLACGVSA